MLSSTNPSPSGNSFLSLVFSNRYFASLKEDQVTPPKINMEHNNGGLEDDDFPFQIGDF